MARRNLLVGGMALAALATPSPAAGEVIVEVNGSPPVLVVIAGDETVDPHGATFVLEHFEDISRNGIRIRERDLPFFESAIDTSDDENCFGNSAANDVVCTPFPSRGIIHGDSADDIIDIGGSNGGCVATPGTPFEVFLDGGDDRLNARSACGGQASAPGINRLHPIVTANGGEGNDVMIGGALPDELDGSLDNDDVRGNDGADTLIGSSGDDLLKGGFGDDTLDGGAPDEFGIGGEDTLQGGAGNDTLDGDVEDDLLDGGSGSDTIDGGSDFDTASYASGLAVTIDFGDTDAGGAAAGDDLISIEGFVGSAFADQIGGLDERNVIKGGGGDDTLVGRFGDDALLGQAGADTLDGDLDDDTLNGGTGDDTVIGDRGDDTLLGSDGNDALRGLEQNDSVLGGDGDDTLEGGDGNDSLVGGPGTDVFRAGSGNDFIDSRDGIAESVGCSFGFDTVMADLQDTVPVRHPLSDINCESITRSPVDDGPPGRVIERSVAIARDGSVALRIRCPRRARVTCRGRLRMTTARRPRRTLATTRYAIKRRRTTVVELALSRRAAAHARRGGVVIAMTREFGVSKKGARGVVVALRVR